MLRRIALGVLSGRAGWRIAVAVALRVVLPSDVTAQGSNGESPRGTTIHIAPFYAVNLPGGGWGFAEVTRVAGARLEVTLDSRWVAWVSAGSGQLRMFICFDRSRSCKYQGTPWPILAGISFRLRSDGRGRLVPYVGAGAGRVYWRGGADPDLQLHAGGDFVLHRLLALRIEGQAQKGTDTHNLAFGVRVPLF